jgi:hypothetical protein
MGLSSRVLRRVGVPASVAVNGKKVAELPNGTSTIVDIAPGADVIFVTGLSNPGRFSVRLAVKPGQRYAVKVESRSESFVPGVMLGPVGGIIDASVNENAGPFQLRFVDVKEAGA